jgi:DNA-directed RNA polymerase subunit RPC12/RpoP
LLIQVKNVGTQVGLSTRITKHKPFFPLLGIRLLRQSLGGYMFDIGTQETEIGCPECSQTIPVKLDQVAKEDTITCGGCGKAIQLKDVGGSAARAIRDLNASMADLQRTLKRFGS